ncbi:MAG: hypothetical protein ACE5JP_10915 [Candidatus Bipolaricaulia bacterium]
MHVLYLLSVWLHILAAAIWIGGMVFLALILVPVTRRPEHRGIAVSLIHWTGVRFRWVGWICLGLLLLSGIFNLAYLLALVVVALGVMLVRGWPW